MAFELIWEGHRATVCYSGHVTDEQTNMAVSLIQSDWRCDELREILHDGRGCQTFAFSNSTTEEIAAVDGALALSNPRIKIAIVSDRPDVKAAVEWYISRNFSPFPTQLFADFAEADVWLRSRD